MFMYFFDAALIRHVINLFVQVTEAKKRALF